MHLWEKLSNLTGASFISTDTNSEPSLNFRDTIVIYLNNVPQIFETAKSYNKRPLQIKNNPANIPMSNSSRMINCGSHSMEYHTAVKISLL